MTDKKTTEKETIAKELRGQQKFSMAGAIGRAGGGGVMKGASPIPRRDQAHNELVDFIKANCSDPSGALKSLLGRRLKSSGPLLEKHLDNPKQALTEMIQSILDNEARFHEFVRQVDVRWGELYQERPHFQQPGQNPHPDDEYSHESVRRDLLALQKKIDQTP
jgi:hypothetical protein